MRLSRTVTLADIMSGVPFELNRNSPQATGLVGWWPMLGSRGMGNLRDLSGRGLDGAFNGGLTWVADAKMGAALAFDGSTGYISVGDKPQFENIDEITITAWIVGTAFAGSAGIVSKGDYYNAAASFSFGAGAITGGARLLFSVANNPFLFWDGITSAQWQQWMHVGVVYSKTRSLAQLYVNGRIVQDGLIGGSFITIPDSVASLNIGRSTDYWTGMVGGVLISNYCSPSLMWQMADPATMWDLYAPIRTQWYLPYPFVRRRPKIIPELATIAR